LGVFRKLLTPSYFSYKSVGDWKIERKEGGEGDIKIWFIHDKSFVKILLDFG